MYDVGTRKYMKIELTPEFQEKISKIHIQKAFGEGVDPLEGNILNVKVPYRYKRVDCTVAGLTPVEELREGDEIFVTIQFSGSWRSGLYWRFDLIQKTGPPGGS